MVAKFTPGQLVYPIGIGRMLRSTKNGGYVCDYWSAGSAVRFSMGNYLGEFFSTKQKAQEVCDRRNKKIFERGDRWKELGLL